MRRRLALLLSLSLAPACLGGGDDDGDDRKDNGDGEPCLQSGIAGDSEADHCAALFLAALTCLGSPDGLQFQWTVASLEDQDTSDIVVPANVNGAMLTIPAQTLQAGANYDFTVDITAPDGRSEHFEHAVAVLPRGPFQVSIPGGPTLNHYRSQQLTLTGEATGGACAVQPSFQWTQLGPSFVDFTSVTTASAMLVLEPFTTQVNETYGFQLTSRAGEDQSSASVVVNVVPQPLDVQIAGGDSTVGLGSMLVLDAGGSRDPDLQVGASDNLTYEWAVIDQDGNATDVVLPNTAIVEFDPVADRRLLNAAGVAAGGVVGHLDFRVTITGNGKTGVATSRAHFVCDLNASPVSVQTVAPIINLNDSSSSFVDLVTNFQNAQAVTVTAWHTLEWRETAHDTDLTNRVLSGGLDEQNVRLNLYGLADSNYVFEVDATLCGSVENDAVTTRLNTPPSGGTFTVSSTTPDTDDDVVFTASGWSDGDGGLTYQFSLLSSGGQATVLNATPSSSPQLTTRITEVGTFTPRVRVTDAVGGSTTFSSSSTITVTSAVPPGVDENNLTVKSAGFSAELLAFAGESYNTLFETGYAGTASAATTVTLYTNPTVDRYRTVIVLADMDAGGAVGSLGVNYGVQPTSPQGCFAHIRSGGKYGVIMRVENGKSLVMRRYASSVGGLSGTFEVIVLYGNSTKYYQSTAAEPMKISRNDSAGTCFNSWPIHFGWATPPPPSSPDPNPMEWKVEICPPAGSSTPCTVETYPVASNSMYPNRNVPKDWSVTIRTVNTDGGSHVAEFTTAFNETNGYRFVELRAPVSN